MIDDEKNILTESTSKQVDGARSIHVLCLDARGQVLLSESEGKFKLEEWMEVVEHAKDILLGSGSGEGGKMEVEDDTRGGIDLIRKTITTRLAKQEAWRQSG